MSKKQAVEEKQVERKSVSTKENADVSRLTAFVDSLSTVKSAAAAVEQCSSEQEMYLLALAIVREKLSDRFTFTQFASAVNESEKCKKLSLTAYLYKQRKAANVLSLRESTHSICADRVLHRERVAQIHKSAKTSNSFSTVHVASALLDRAKHETDNQARAREVFHSLNSNAISLLESIVKIVSK